MTPSAPTKSSRRSALPKLPPRNKLRNQTPLDQARSRPDQPIEVPLTALRPTQVAVGMRAVAAKRKRLGCHARKRNKLERYLAKRPIPAVYGPGREIYIIDHHHLSLALLHNDVAFAPVDILADYSHLSSAAFWSAMEDRGLVYPFDERGCRVAISRLPKTISKLRSDTFRDLAWSVREAGGFQKSCTPFSEFRWAEFFRASIDAHLVDRDYHRAVALATKLARSAAAEGLPGFRGR